MGYPEKEIWIKCRQELSTSVEWGVAQELKKIDSFKIMQVYFEAAEGGQERLFGKIIKETTNAYKVKRFFLYENDQLKKAYSVNDIMSFKTEKIDTMTFYIVPD
jgi:homoserine dehydrogenase